ncbi:PAS domain S-box protein [Oscillatoria sp. FACHB-1407]|uniref:PAS domain S-box protein n=1 Tax=Oscillatoria sp. FACHB-1407 TaxID=2692847 RepID=UPI0016870F1E|nr:PAS domain S-box protein [Oscillatoria sp. FACHB-1407]MBD2459823.1 PAS domain S-box protein [Oscillatoria sp. FACHB-1407]
MKTFRVSGKPTLKTVLIVPFVLQVSIAVGLTGYFSWRNGQKMVDSVAQQLSNEVTNQIHQHLTHYMQLPQTVTQFNTEAVQLGQVNWSRSRTIEQYLWRQMRQFKDLSPIAFGNEQGNIWAVDRTEDGSLVIRVRDASTQGEYRTYATNDQGDRTELLQVNTSFDPRSRPWYQKAIAANGLIWTDIYPYFSSAGLAISAARPFYDFESNQVIGVTNATVSLAQLNHFLRRINLSPSGQMFIVERSGNLVASSTLEDPFIIRPEQRPARLAMTASRDPLTRQTAQQLLKDFGTLAHIQRNQQLEFYIDGDRHFLQVAPFTDSYGLDWLIVVVIPESDFTAQLTANTQTTVMLCLLALVGAIAFGWVTTQGIAQPILQLCRASRAMADGQLDQQIDADSAIQELDVMAHSFNQMAEQLRQSFAKVKLALHESEEKFTKVFHSSPDPMVIATLESGRFSDVNDSTLKLLGFSRDEFIGHTAGELDIWEDGCDRDRYLQLLREQGWVRDYEMTFRCKSGQPKILLISADIIDLEGERRVISMGKDISDRKQAEAALWETNHLLQSILDSAPVAIYVKDLEGRYLIVNAQVEDNINISQDKILGKTDYELFSSDIAEQLQVNDQKVIASGSVVRQEEVISHEHGSYTFLSAKFPLYNSDGTLQGIGGISVDLTERKQAEDLIRASLEEKEVLLKEIHHRVKNNLQIVSSLLRLQARSIDDEKIQTLFQESQNRVQAMALIHKKLYGSKELAHIDFVSYVQSLADDLMDSYEVQPSSIQLMVDLEPVDLNIDIAISCGLIINELITNILKYAFPTEHGEIKIRGRVLLPAREVPPTVDPYYELSVCDNGIGLPDTFDIHQTTTLGLRLVSRLTRQLRGTIDIDRSNGTLIKITFPALRDK